MFAAFFSHWPLIPQDRTVIDRSHEAIKQWFHWLKHLFEPDCQDRHETVVDGTIIEIDDQEVYVWMQLMVR